MTTLRPRSSAMMYPVGFLELMPRVSALPLSFNVLAGVEAGADLTLLRLSLFDIDKHGLRRFEMCKMICLFEEMGGSCDSSAYCT